MKFWFTRARTEDQAFVVLMRDVCLRRLIAELEALGEVGDAVTSLNHIREIVGREFTKLAVLEQLSASTDVVYGCYHLALGSDVSLCVGSGNRSLRRIERCEIQRFGDFLEHGYAVSSFMDTAYWLSEQ
ncbi:hypothetical protein Tco_1265139 [Tanacetum coccineum]